MIRLHYKKETYEIPDTWNELSQTQLLQVATILHTPMREYDMLVELFRVVSGMSWYRFFTLPPDIMCDCLNYITYIREGNTLTVQLIPHYKGFYGPKKELENLRGKEFALTEVFFLAWRNDNDMEALDELIAILYRPGKKRYDISQDIDGDVRVPFNPHLSPFLKKKISRWPAAVKHAIALYYEGCRGNFVKAYQPVFEGEEGATSPPYGLWNILRDIAEKGVFGDMDKVEEQYVDTVLMEMHTQVIKAQEYERALKKMSSHV